METVSVSLSGASGFCSLSIVGWHCEPSVVARMDGQDVITVDVTRQYADQRVRLVQLRKGKLQLIALATSSDKAPQVVEGRLPKLVPDSDVAMTIQLPPELIGVIDILTERG